MTLDEVLREHRLLTFNLPEFNEIVSRFTSNTRFDNHLVVNSPVMPGMLGVFFCRFDPSGILRQLRGNCLYTRGVDDRHFILCDIDFLINPENALRDARDPTGIPSLPAIPSTSELNPRMRDYEEQFRQVFRTNLVHFFPRWVIGHEVGHAVLGHGEERLRLGNLGELQNRRESREREISADRFVIERMAGDELSRWHFFNALTHSLNNWIKAETGMSSVDIGDRSYSGAIIEIKDDSPTHPPMIIRLLNLMETFLQRFPETDTTGFYSRIHARIKPVGKYGE